MGYLCKLTVRRIVNPSCLIGQNGLTIRLTFTKLSDSPRMKCTILAFILKYFVVFYPSSNDNNNYQKVKTGLFHILVFRNEV